MVLAIALSLVTALLFAVASVLQQKGTEAPTGTNALGAGFLAVLARRPMWLGGMAADVVGFGTQTWALAVGSLLLVQPLLVSTLLFALPLAAWVQHRRLAWREWVWAGVLAIALALFVILGQPQSGLDRPTPGAWIVPGVIVVPLVVVCILWARKMPHGRGRSLLLALGSGVLLGVSAPLTKTGVNAFSHGFWHGVGTWELWGAALTAALGTLWQQSSYQAGDVQTSLPTVTVLKPVVAMVLGLTIYRETLSVGVGGDVVIIVALAVMIVAAVRLARLAAPDLAPGEPLGEVEAVVAPALEIDPDATA